MISRVYFHCQADRIDTSAIKPSALSNTGILRLSLHAEEGEGKTDEGDGKSGGGEGKDAEGASDVVADVNLVVQVQKNAKGEFIRCIYNPMEE